MLIQVAIENFKSIDEEIVFKMIASPIQGHASHLTQTNFTKPSSLLRFGAIYGGNASGKTNFIDAVSFARDYLINGRDFNQPVGVQQFRFSGSKEKRPTIFEFTVWLENQIYTYGFALTMEGVEEEWLYAQRSGAQQRKLFERISGDEHAEIASGKSLEEDGFTSKTLQMIARTTRVNQLYLHELVDKNHAGIRPLVNWFKQSLMVIPAVSRYRELIVRARQDKKFTQFLSRLLKRVGTGIERIELKGKKIDPDRDLTLYPAPMRDNLMDSLSKLPENNGLMISSERMQRVYEKKNGAIKEFQLKSVHLDKNGLEVELPIEEESEGTQRLVHLAPLFFDAMEHDLVVFIDELDRRLHPLLSRTLISVFNEVSSENSKSQLIFSTHDTNLFDQELLRRDEIWIMEKDQYGASALHSLLDFKIRNDKRLDKNYLLGRFGGIPNIRHEIINGAHA